MDILYFLGMALTGYVSGLLGALLGLGGGVFIVAALRLIYGVPFLMAVGTSNMAVIATSTGGAATYVRNGLANIRLALILLASTTTAALAASL
ncbi:MAG: TSUP family transporter, partial [Chloroflexota bacterium]